MVLFRVQKARPGVYKAIVTEPAERKWVRPNECDSVSLLESAIDWLPGHQQQLVLSIVTHGVLLSHRVQVLIRNPGVVSQPQFQPKIRFDEEQSPNFKIVPYGPWKNGQYKEQHRAAQ